MNGQRTPTTVEPVRPAFLRPKVAAQYVGLSRRHLHNLTTRGLFPVHRLGKRCLVYAIADLEAGMARLRRGAIGENARGAL